MGRGKMYIPILTSHDAEYTDVDFVPKVLFSEMIRNLSTLGNCANAVLLPGAAG
jgi:hypothetical protein